MKLLLIATDARLVVTVRSWMGMNGTTVEWLVLGTQAERTLHESRYDSVVLDSNLPDVSTTEVLRRIRHAGHHLPLVIVADSDDTQERIRLLDLGADDYVVKPVRVAELAARLRALLRRCSTGYAAENELRHGDLRVATQSRTVSKDGSRVLLTEKEYSLLEALVRNKGLVVSRQRLEEIMNGKFCELSSNPLEVHVHHLRRKLGAHLISTVRGVGYMLGQVA